MLIWAIIFGGPDVNVRKLGSGFPVSSTSHSFPPEGARVNQLSDQTHLQSIKVGQPEVNLHQYSSPLSSRCVF